MLSITEKLRQWLLKGAVTIRAEKVEFNNCDFTITGGAGLAFDGGEVTIHGNLTASSEEGWATALYLTDHSSLEVHRSTK